MKRYLIRIESDYRNECVTIYGDTPTRPFIIANNLWNYRTPGHAARKLETLAQCWETSGLTVKRIYGSVADMPTRGNKYNVESTLIDYNASSKTYPELIKEYY